MSPKRAILRISLILNVLLIIVLLAGYIPVGVRWMKEHALDLGLVEVDPAAPHAEAMKRLMRQLRYSGLPSIMRPDFSISIDFMKQTWTAHRIHRVGPDGHVKLEDGQSGACGDLAAWLFDQARPLFEESYAIDFVRVAEAQFFPAPLSSHYVLRIVDLKTLKEDKAPQTYIADPAFHRYGPVSEFEDYLFYEPREQLAFMRTGHADEEMPIGQGVPVVIHSKLLLGLAVGREGKKFDPEHYRLSLVATWRYRYAGRTILIFRKLPGRVEVVENAKLAAQAMPAADYARLKERLRQLFDEIELIQ